MPEAMAGYFWLNRRWQSDFRTNAQNLIWEASYARGYKIQVSTNGITWTDVYTQSNSSGGTERIPITAQGRYVRMQGTQLSGQWGYSLYEMQVYG